MFACVEDLHDDNAYIGLCLLMVSLNHPSYRKCIGFADLQVNILLQNLHSAAYEIPGIDVFQVVNTLCLASNITFKMNTPHKVISWSSHHSITLYTSTTQPTLALVSGKSSSWQRVVMRTRRKATY